MLDEELERLGPSLAGRVLEVGAGRGSRRGWFATPAAAHWITVDRDESVGPHVVGDLTRLPFRDVSRDAVVCLEVLEYVEEPDRALSELARVLAPGGQLVVSMPFLHRWDAPNDLWRVTPAGLSRLLERNGFRVARLTAQGAAAATVANVVRDLALHAAPPFARRFAGYAAFVLCEALFRLDRAATGQRVASFSTGLLAVATKP